MTKHILFAGWCRWVKKTGSPKTDIMTMQPCLANDLSPVRITNAGVRSGEHVRYRETDRPYNQAPAHSSRSPDLAWYWRLAHALFNFTSPHLSQIMAGAEEAKFTGMAKYFNSYTMTGRANVSTAAHVAGAGWEKVTRSWRGANVRVLPYFIYC